MFLLRDEKTKTQREEITRESARTQERKRETIVCVSGNQSTVVSRGFTRSGFETGEKHISLVLAMGVRFRFAE